MLESVQLLSKFSLHLPLIFFPLARKQILEIKRATRHSLAQSFLFLKFDKHNLLPYLNDAIHGLLGIYFLRKLFAINSHTNKENLRWLNIV